MVVNVTVTEDTSLPIWDAGRFSCTTDLFSISASSSSIEHVINFVKGSILCAIGRWVVVPDKVEFKVTCSNSLVPPAEAPSK